MPKQMNATMKSTQEKMRELQVGLLNIEKNLRLGEDIDAVSFVRTLNEVRNSYRHLLDYLNDQSATSADQLIYARTHIMRAWKESDAALLDGLMLAIDDKISICGRGTYVGGDPDLFLDARQALLAAYAFKRKSNGNKLSEDGYFEVVNALLAVRDRYECLLPYLQARKRRLRMMRFVVVFALTLLSLASVASFAIMMDVLRRGACL